MKILMVCLGNICRSPLAEGILQKKANEAGLKWIVQSAGTNGFHDGEAPHHLSQKVAKKNGYDISKQVSRKFTKFDVEEYDRIYVMAADVKQAVISISGDYFKSDKIDYFLNELYPGTNKDVPDPWYGDEDGYDEAFELINAACDAILENHFAKKNIESNV
jgi:protein-tyrosine phosphatase